MLVKLFDVQNGKVIPSEHCYSLKTLKNIMDQYPDTYMEVYLYIFYMQINNQGVENENTSSIKRNPQDTKQVTQKKDYQGEP